MEPSQEQELRSRFVSKIRKYYPHGRRRKKSKDTATLQEKHACVLGIRGFVTGYPYDIPDWMPELLTLLVPAAGEPPPVMTTVTKTLGELDCRTRVVKCNWGC